MHWQVAGPLTLTACQDHTTRCIDSARSTGPGPCFCNKLKGGETARYNPQLAVRCAAGCLVQCVGQKFSLLPGRVLTAFCQPSARTKFGFWEGISFALYRFSHSAVLPCRSAQPQTLLPHTLVLCTAVDTRVRTSGGPPGGQRPWSAATTLGHPSSTLSTRRPASQNASTARKDVKVRSSQHTPSATCNLQCC